MNNAHKPLDGEDPAVIALIAMLVEVGREGHLYRYKHQGNDARSLDIGLESYETIKDHIQARNDTHSFYLLDRAVKGVIPFTTELELRHFPPGTDKSSLLDYWMGSFPGASEKERTEARDISNSLLDSSSDREEFVRAMLSDERLLKLKEGAGVSIVIVGVHNKYRDLVDRTAEFHGLEVVTPIKLVARSSSGVEVRHPLNGLPNVGAIERADFAAEQDGTYINTREEMLEEIEMAQTIARERRAQ